MVTGLKKKVSLPKITSLDKKHYFAFGALAVLLILPAGLHGNRHLMQLLVMAFIWGSLTASWDLMLGYARIFSLGHIAFFAIGGYTTAILSMQMGFSPWLSMFLGALLASGIGFLIGLPCLRLRGTYVGIITLTLHLVMPTLIVNAEFLGTGGSYGLTGIPTLQVGGYVFPEPIVSLVPWYYLGFGICFAVIFAVYKIINSPLGLAFVALRDAEPLAKSSGIDEYKHSLILFGISAFLAGITGAFYAHFIGVMSPRIFDLGIFLFAFIMVMFGGMGRFPGPVIGAFIITFLNDALLATGASRLLILGAIIVVTMIYLPEGMMGIPEYVNRFIKRRAARRQIVER